MAAAPPVVLDKALMLLEAIIADGGQSTLGALADSLALPRATAYRLTAALVDRGLVVTCGQGRYLPGGALMSAFAAVGPRDVLARVATPILGRAARRFGQIAHLGVFEGDMVTYLVKVGAGGAAHFTRPGMQLEAYCSAMGKVLLAHLPAADLDAYLANGPFVRLTPNTTIDPDRLRAHLAQVHGQGFALDEQEIAEDLRCVAVPIRDRRGAVGAAISISAPPARLSGDRLLLARRLLEEAALRIHQRLYRPARDWSAPAAMRVSPETIGRRGVIWP
jgi:DNA-binding IclR family transcriptional regulator